MKSNVIILKVFNGDEYFGEIVGKFLRDQYEYDVKHDWEYHVFYYRGIDGNTYYNMNGKERVEKAANDASVYMYDYPGIEHRSGKSFRKRERAHRVNLMTSHIWAPDGVFGKNRRLRRRMWPNAEDFRNAEEELPF